MHWRAQNARPRMREMLLCNLRMSGLAMVHKVHTTFLMSLGVALTLASNQAFGQAVLGGRPTFTHSNFHHPFVHNRPNFRPLVNHRLNRRNFGSFFPGGFFFGPSNGPFASEVAQPFSEPVTGDFHYTYKYDVPWDWAHRYPPSFFASPPGLPAPPVNYQPGCAAQTITVPGGDGKDQSISMVRC